jgi:hypothetical protein
MRASLVLIPLLAGAAATVALAIGACSNPDTQSPNCHSNVNANGLYADPNDNMTCYGFAACPSGEPSTCCVDDNGAPLTGNDLATCLHGYGDTSCAFLISSTTVDDAGAAGVAYTCSATMPSGTGGSDGG